MPVFVLVELMRSTTRRLGWCVAISASPRSSPPVSVPTAFRPAASPPHTASSSPFTTAAFGTPKRCYIIRTRSLRQSWNAERVRPWMCSKKECRVVNKAVASLCEACGTKKPVLQRWKCVGCGTVNFSGVKMCKQCEAPVGKSAEYWMCADCGENNRVDALEDNSICGFCGYDMAPRTAAQEEALRRASEAAAALQQQQENFDSISFKEADEQFSDPLDGAHNLPTTLRSQQQSTGVHGGSRHLTIPTVTPFEPTKLSASMTLHSKLHRKHRVSAAQRAVLNAADIPSGPPGFDWMCRSASCGHINPGDEEKCLMCAAHIKPEEWECLMCGAANHLSRSRCFHCRTAIPVCWTCRACNTATSIYEKTCRSCGVERPPTEPKRVKEVLDDDGFRANGVTTQRDQRRGEWYCPSCNKLNYSRRDECFSCGEKRPGGQSSAAGGDAFAASGWGADATTLGQPAASPAPLHNNWICVHCQASNFRTRHDCWKCGRASENHHAWSAETAAPQFEHEGFQTGSEDRSAEGQMNSTWKVDKDKWTCAKCYAQNFKNRADCYRCGASKTAVLAPRRSKARRPVKL